MAQYQSAEWRENIARGVRRRAEVKRLLARIVPSEITALEHSGSIAPSLRPYAVQAASEADGLVTALGGQDQVSEQRMVLVQDTARLGLLARALTARVLQGGAKNMDEIGKLTSVLNARRANLVALGLERLQREVDLASYIAETGTEEIAQ